MIEIKITHKKIIKYGLPELLIALSYICAGIAFWVINDHNDILLVIMVLLLGCTGLHRFISVFRYYLYNKDTVITFEPESARLTYTDKSVIYHISIDDIAKVTHHQAWSTLFYYEIEFKHNHTTLIFTCYMPIEPILETIKQHPDIIVENINDYIINFLE